MRSWLLMLALILTVGPVFAKVVTKTVEYKDGNQTLAGYLAYDDSIQGKRPGVLVLHEWNGLGHYIQWRAREMARLGYVAFAADIYGKNVHPSNPDEFKKESGKYYADRPLMRSRVQAALSQLTQNPMVDTAKIAAIGYCFGGAVALELGRTGAPLLGIVTVHGGLADPIPADDANIKAKVLILQGGDDKFTLGDLPALENSFKSNKVDYRVVTYPGAVHGFSNPDNKGSIPGILYNEKADKASWREMVDFLKKIFNS